MRNDAGHLLAVASTLLLASASWAQWETLDGGANLEVRSFRIDTANNRLLIGGSFPFVQGNALRANSLAWWNGLEWSVEGLANGNGDNSQYGIPNPVLSVAIRGDTIFAGHLNTWWHQDSTMGYAAMLVNGLWQPCGSPNGIFYFLESQGRMFSGGVHDSLYGEYAPGIHEWRNGAFVDIPGMPFTSRVAVYDVEYWHGKFYFGGTFNILGSPRIIAYNGVDQWTPVGNGVGGYFIETICGYGDSLYVAGFLQPGPNVQSTHIQLWDGSTWKPFFPQVEFVGATRDIQVHDGVLYIAGVHHWVGDDTWYGLLRYDGHQLCSIGGPTPGGDNGKMAFFQNKLYLGMGAQFVGLEYQFIGKLPLEGLVPDRCLDVGPNNIEEGATDAVLQLFPNPTSEKVTLQFPAQVRTAKIELFDGVGRTVHSQPVKNVSSAVVDLSNLASGSYTAVVSGDSYRWTSKILRSR
ncbi:MAG: T9SS type A sorting domain-containing protein [Flavobacteriales bacterium]|jgi:hypothetical protein|nr:T9SS type A sorting domain-containing protein [Flavobacteriales bacterium]